MSQDPLLLVTPWLEEGTQLAFDAGDVPLRVSLFPGPMLADFHGDRSVLQDCGTLLAISAIPAGKPSGAWARAIGFALQQLWREGAARAEYGRVGDTARATAHFKPFTRRKLLELFPPEPSVQDILNSNDPARAVGFWETAIATLRTGENRIIGHYAGAKGAKLRDWRKDRPRKGWADAWLTEELDIRPIAEAAEELSAIATSRKTKTRKRNKEVGSRRPSLA
jgi:hypothetical protein